jgi:hypothetical protein
VIIQQGVTKGITYVSILQVLEVEVAGVTNPGEGPQKLGYLQNMDVYILKPTDGAHPSILVNVGVNIYLSLLQVVSVSL